MNDDRGMNSPKTGRPERQLSKSLKKLLPVLDAVCFFLFVFCSVNHTKRQVFSVRILKKFFMSIQTSKLTLFPISSLITLVCTAPGFFLLKSRFPLSSSLYHYIVINIIFKMEKEFVFYCICLSCFCNG